MSERKADVVPFDPMQCMDMCSGAVAVVAMAQAAPWAEDASRDAERMCEELFGEFYGADDRARYLATMAYLAIDLAANVSHTMDRAQLRHDMEGMD